MKRESGKNTLVWARLLILVLALLLVMPACKAANHFVRAGAVGTATGADWTNAFTDLPANLIRGDVYYVAAGTYAHHLFNDADSGTAVIEVRAATIADHGTPTGWSDSFQGEAVFSPTGKGTPFLSVFEFVTDFYLINGSGVRNADWQRDYLIRVSDANKLASNAVVLIGHGANSDGPGIFVHDITLDYVNIEGSHAAADTDIHERALQSRCGGSNIAIRHSYAHDTGEDIFFIKGKHDSTLSSALCNASSTGAQLTVEYTYFARNYSSAAIHGQGLECEEGQFCVIRYNIFRDITGTAYLATPSGCTRLTCNIDTQWDVYGNVFLQKNTFQDNGVACGVGGVIQCFDAAFSGPLKFFNNTMVNINSSICPNNAHGAAITIFDSPACNLNGGLFVQNNLWYNNEAFSAQNTCSTCRTTTWDHNAYFTQTVTDTDGTAQIGNGNPFLGSTIDNFHLAAATSAGVSLLAPYNTDMDGTTRGVDGVWDRGAFEFDSGKRPPLPPPTVAAVIH